MGFSGEKIPFFVPQYYNFAEITGNGCLFARHYLSLDVTVLASSIYER